jgi:uncharacterized membrane protein YeaQ/YmgE (transglycosylase-associated protein family)
METSVQEEGGNMGAFAVMAVIALIAAVFTGYFLIGLTMKLAYFAISGLVIGAVARFALPGEQPMGLVATAGFGVAGSLLGGAFAGSLFGLGLFGQLLLSVLASIGLIAALAKSKR